MRGKILRDTNNGQGILFLEGEQKPFTLEQHWRSPNPPKVGMLVDVVLDEDGQVLSVTEVSQAEVLKEQARKAGAVLSSQGQAGFEALKEQASRASALIQEKGAAGAGRELLKSGISLPLTLALVFLLMLAWVAFALIKVKMLGVSISLSEGLKGFNAFLMWVVLLSPLISLVWRHPYAVLTKCIPAVYMLWQSIASVREISRGMSMAGSMMGRRNADAAAGFLKEFVSFGFGFYLSIAVVLALAALGIWEFLQARKAQQQAALPPL